MKEITAVTVNGINYIDEDGNACFLDFEVCHQNYIKFRQEKMGSQYSNELKQLDAEFKFVGYRSFSANPSFIAFYTIPQTRFEFPTSGKFSEIVYKTRKAGWWITDWD